MKNIAINQETKERLINEARKENPDPDCPFPATVAESLEVPGRREEEIKKVIVAQRRLRDRMREVGLL